MRDRSRLESVSGSPAGHWKADPDKIRSCDSRTRGNCAQLVGGLVLKVCVFVDHRDAVAEQAQIVGNGLP